MELGRRRALALCVSRAVLASCVSKQPPPMRRDVAVPPGLQLGPYALVAGQVWPRGFRGEGCFKVVFAAANQVVTPSFRCFFLPPIAMGNNLSSSTLPTIEVRQGTEASHQAPERPVPQSPERPGTPGSEGSVQRDSEQNGASLGVAARWPPRQVDEADSVDLNAEVRSTSEISARSQRG